MLALSRAPAALFCKVSTWKPSSDSVTVLPKSISTMRKRQRVTVQGDGQMLTAESVGWGGEQAPPASSFTLVSCRISRQQRHQRETVELQVLPGKPRETLLLQDGFSTNLVASKQPAAPAPHHVQGVILCKWNLCRASLQLLLACQHHILPHRHPKAVYCRKQQRWVFQDFLI